MFLLSAEKNKLAVLQKVTITSGSVNVYDVRFQFDSDWDDMERYAVFRVGSERVSILLDDENTCKIPWECLRDNDIGEGLYVGVYGMKGDTVVLPTIWARMGMISEGTKLGDTALPPSPSVAEQVLAQIIAARDEAIAARDAAILAAGGTIPDTDDGTEDDGNTDAEGEESGDVATDDEVNDALDNLFGEEGTEEDGGSTEDDGGSTDDGGDDTITDDEVATDDEVNDMFDDIFGT